MMKNQTHRKRENKIHYFYFFCKFINDIGEKKLFGEDEMDFFSAGQSWNKSSNIQILIFYLIISEIEATIISYATRK